MKYLILSSIWAGYCFLHSFLISVRFTNYLTRVLKNYYSFYRLFYVLISLVLLVWVINYTAPLDTTIIITYVPPWSIIRQVTMWGSLLMFFWAFFFNYDSLSFFGIRQILNFKKLKTTNPSEEIKKNGLLAVTRHPMYLALIVYLWSQTFRVADIVVNIVLTIYVIIGTVLEEKKLVLEFGDAYRKYQQEVPMLIPFTKKRKVAHY
jgi:protein-S-isoprenylcysteine O-methyltransferase Ste14